MPRPITAGERTILGSPLIRTHVRCELRNPDDVWVDVTTAFASNVFVAAAWDEKLDRHVASGQIVLAASDGVNSLAPAIGASLINRNGAAAYAPFLAVGREFRITTAVTLPSVAPVAGDWRERVSGYIDRVNISPNAQQITLPFRDRGGRLADAQIRTPIVVGVDGGTPMETAMQALIDAVLPAGHGVALYTPISPGMGVWPYELPAGGNLLEALNALARKAGAVVSYRYDAAWVSRLTLWIPPRTKTVADATIGPHEYFVLPQFDTAIDDVRNVVEVEYFDVSLGNRSSQIYTNIASVAAVRHERYMKIAEADGSPVREAAQALALATAAGSDLGSPPTEQQVALRHWWPAQIADLYAFQPNGTHYDSEQKLAITGIRTALEPAGERTVLETRGNVAGSYKGWHTPTGPTPEPLPDLPIARAFEVGSDADSVLFSIDGSPGAGVLGGLEWQYIVWRDKLDAVPAWPVGWLQAPTYALPYMLDLTRAPARDQVMRVRVRDAAGRISEPEQRIIPAQIPAIDDTGAPKRSYPYDDGGYGTRATDAGGLQLHGGVKDDRAALLNAHFRYAVDGAGGVVETGAQSFVKQDHLDGSRRVVGVYSAADGVTQTGANLYEGWARATVAIADRAATLAAAAKDSRAALMNAHFRYAVDGAAGVVEDATRSFVDTNSIDGSRRIYRIIDAVTGTLVPGDHINTGQARARGGFSNSTGGLVSTAEDSRAALLNAHFRYAVDSTAGVVDGAGTPLAGGARAYPNFNSSSQMLRSRGWDDGYSALKANNTTGTLATSDLTDSRSALLNAHFRANVDSTGVIVDGTGSPLAGGARGYLGLNSGGQVAQALPSSIGQHDGVSVRVLAKGHVAGSCRHGDTVVFPVNFNNVPMVLIRGGITFEPRAKWGTIGDGTESGASNYTTAAQRDDVAALNLDAGGFTMRARLRQRATPTLREHYFAANSLTAVGHTVERNLDNAPANNDSYSVFYSVSLTANAGVGAPNTVTLTVAIEVNNGGGWAERATRTYSVQAPVGSSASDSWIREAVTVVASALDSTDDIRIKIKSLATETASGSFAVHGFASGDPEPGVSYQTGADTYASKTPETDDRVYWEAIEVA